MSETTLRRAPAPKAGNARLLNTIKWLLLAGIVLFLFSQLFSQHQSSADFDDVSAAVLEAADLDAMQPADSQMLRRVFSMNASDYDGACTMRRFPTWILQSCCWSGFRI